MSLRRLSGPFVSTSLLLLAGCGGSSGSMAGSDPEVGLLRVTPSGGLFFVDANQGGQAGALALAQTLWARLVDVHDSDANGVRGAFPLMHDAPVRPDLGSDGVDYRLETDALGRQALVILHARGTPAFESALRHALQELPVLPAKDVGSAPPFPSVVRNAALVLRFDDLLASDASAAQSLGDDVRVRVGYPPQTAFGARAFFDASHGALVGQSFHPTRVVLDLTTSPDELEAGADPLALNVVGLPPSEPSSPLANLELRLPSRTDFGAGQFTVLHNLRGRALDAERSAPFDPASSTGEVLRALRSGNDEDLANGFLRDDTPPVLVGRFELAVLDAAAESAPGTFALRVAYRTVCAKAFAPGELLETGAGFLEVVQASAPPSPGGEVADVHARALAATTPSPSELLGLAHVLARFDPAAGLDDACWIEVVGNTGPSVEITPASSLRLRFSEPMDPRSLDPLETLRLYRGARADATSTVVGVVSPSADATVFEFTPTLPLDHQQGVSEDYSLELVGGEAGARDLAGNALADGLPVLALAMSANAASVATGGVTLRFDGPNEYELHDLPGGSDDLRGFFTYDVERGALRPRPVIHQSWPIDSTQGVPSLMLRLPVSIHEPLTRFGSRLQTVWRYADVGWAVADESHYDVDVEGLAWAPFGGQVSSDFFQRFEVRLGHAVQLPDEFVTTGPVFPASGLLDAPAKFDQNVLEAQGARTVHQRDFGYRVQPSALFRAASGTNMMPFPLQGDGRTNEPFVWRDTALQGVGGAGGGGVPLSIETRINPAIIPGSVAPAGKVPSFGLPLLIELRTFAADTAIATNGFQTALGTLGFLFPTFRVHSTGGQTLTGSFSVVDPDLAPVPTGGFDPLSVPPGQPTASASPVFYFGALDTVTRLTRVHTVWFDTQSASPDYLAPLVTPSAGEQPAGTSVLLEFRGATGFVGTGGAENDAKLMDPYGELVAGTTLYPNQDHGWSRDIDHVDGLRYLQVRITFVNNVDTGLSPSLGSLAIAFRRRD